MSGALPMAAQSAHQGDIGLTYQWVHTNTQPGECGCFSLNGAGLSASLMATQHFGGVVEVSGGYNGDAPNTGSSLTLVSYLVGPRYYVRPPWPLFDHAPRPFAQVLVGTAHAGGGAAGIGDHNYAFAARAGGGLDLPLNKSFSLRPLQVDYYLTSFGNATNSHQNNLLIGAGIAYHLFH